MSLRSLGFETHGNVLPRWSLGERELLRPARLSLRSGYGKVEYGNCPSSIFQSEAIGTVHVMTEGADGFSVGRDDGRQSQVKKRNKPHALILTQETK